MKRRILALLLAVLTLTALTAAAVAAETTTETLGAFNLKGSNGYTLTVVGTEATGGFYAGANRFKLTCDGLDGNYSLVLLLKEGETEGTKGVPTPTEKNLQYIDQQNIKKDQTAEFILFPKQMEPGTYNVYVSTNNADLKKVASLEYGTEPEYTLGDINNDGKITATDATYVLQMAVGIGTWTETEILAAQIRGKYPTATDAMLVLKYAVGLINSFDD